MPAHKSEPHPFSVGRLSAYFLSLLGLAACLGGIWFSGRIGIARLLALYGATSNVLPAVNEAVWFSPLDPESHYMRARALQNAGQIASAIPELERATALQPRNFGFWMELGGSYDLAAKPEEAIAAVKRAIQMAPYYAQAHWQLGNLLLRQGRREEAFAEFRLATNSDSSFMPNAVDLAWGAFQGDVQTIEKTLQPQNAPARLALAIVFARRGAFPDAIRLFRLAEDHRDETRSEREILLAELMKGKRYYEAWEVWAVDNADHKALPHDGIARLSNGGFENGLSLTEINFGWRLNPEKPMVAISLDARDPFAETNSLQIHWEGKSSPAVYTAAQLVLVEPNKHYRLSFAARTQELVTGGEPEVVVLNEVEGQLLAAVSIPTGTTSWQNYALEFNSSPETRSVQVVIRRKACQGMPCPAFGTAWFDAFALKATS